ncbi:MAG: ornithine aminomutase subunit alpha [Spirochaetaceae bacterium]|jgi:D-ornithine 4,5-aminomutase subunit alpha|nr:ornithine aminomutase subunit alpha [Spirochaetaceae bacterium]
MQRQDDFNERRKKFAGMSDEDLYKYFWELTGKVVEPLLELGRRNTSPSIERSVLLRMGFSSPDTKAIVNGCIDRGLMGKGAGHVVYKLALARKISVKEAGAMLANGEGWDEAVLLFKRAGGK